MKKISLILTAMTVLLTTSLYAEQIGKSVIQTKHNKNLTLQAIADIQPGLGTIMIEFGHRFYVSYYAAKANNWKLAEYEIHELIEALEIAETTRPKYSSQLKKFESNSLAKLQNSIQKKDWNLFKGNYQKTTIACNTCHKENAHPYIQYSLPLEAPKYLRMSL